MSNLKLRTIGGVRKTLAVTAVTVALFCHATTAFAEPKCWTAVGSDGTVDEADLGTVALSSNSAAVKDAVANATVDIRYNVVAVDGVFGGERQTKFLAV